MIQEQIHPGFWKNIGTGSTFILSDDVTIERQMIAGKGIDPIQLLVSRKFHLRCSLCEYHLFVLGSSEDNVMLMAKIVDTNFDLRVYNAIPLPPGTRKDMIAAGHLFLFEQPADPSNFRYQELVYAKILNLNIGEISVPFDKKDFGEMNGSCQEFPRRSGMPPEMFVTLSEYVSRTAIPNPEALILEIGSPNSAEGGFISLYEGRNIRTGDVDVIRR